MSRTLKAYRYSIGLHVLILMSVILLNRNLDIPTQVIRMDFTLLESSSSSDLVQNEPVITPSAIKPAPAKIIVKETTQDVLREKETPAKADVKESLHSIPQSMPDTRLLPVQTNEEKGLKSEAAVMGYTGVQSNLSSVSAGADVSLQESKRQIYLREQFEYIRQKILQQLTYPGVARKMGWMGQVTLAFTIQKNGRAADFRIVRSSGFDLLDADAIEAVKKSSPFPQPPVRAEIVMPIIYRLN